MAMSTEGRFLLNTAVIGFLYFWACTLLVLLADRYVWGRVDNAIKKAPVVNKWTRVTLFWQISAQLVVFGIIGGVINVAMDSYLHLPWDTKEKNWRQMDHLVAGGVFLALAVSFGHNGMGERVQLLLK